MGRGSIIPSEGSDLDGTHTPHVPARYVSWDGFPNLLDNPPAGGETRHHPTRIPRIGRRAQRPSPVGGVRCTRMKWSVNGEWGMTSLTLGMWQETQPFVGL